MFDSLGYKLQESIQKLRGQKSISEDNIDSALNDIRRNLLEADVSLKVVKLFTSRVKEKAIGAEVLTGINPGQQLVKIIHDELTAILGGGLELGQLNLNQKPARILLLGLQGAGKTTTAAKLAYKLKKEGLNPLLVPCDLQRPAAVKQLKILAEQAQVDFLDITEEDLTNYKVKSPLELSKLAFAQAEKNKNQALIFDTAGRLQVDTDLMAELLLLEKQIKPDEKLLVIDSLIGQEAANVAETFNTQIGITGTILTKLDSDTRGGAALSVVEASGKPIKLASVGEKLEDLENFYPERMASRILGMGDVLSLVEKAEEKFSEEEQKRLEAELMKGNFNYETFLTFQSMLSKLGNFSSVFKMMGMGQIFSNMGISNNDQENMLEQSQSKFAKYKIAINSMTKQERRQSELLGSNASAKSRRSRIAKGSGLKESDIDQLASEFGRMSKAFQSMGPMLNMMNQEGNKNTMVNPMDMLSNMMGGMNKKQKQALKMSGMVPGNFNKPNVKMAKKGEKPNVKGFRD